MNPQISVLIPLYNRNQYISVLSQSFQDFEIIVRDDGSYDFVRKKYAKHIGGAK